MSLEHSGDYKAKKNVKDSFIITSEAEVAQLV
jgi:hypothetical protein